MIYMGDEAFWNEKFKARTTQLAPEQSLVSIKALLKPGTVLDVACGDGRNALYLMNEGFCVTGIDFSQEGLNKLSNDSKGGILTQKIDLNDITAFESLGTYDNVIINHYRLNAEKMIQLINHLSSDGLLYVSGFDEKHVPDQKIKSRDLIRSRDFDGIRDQVICLVHETFEDSRGHFVTYVFKKK